MLLYAGFGFSPPFLAWVLGLCPANPDWSLWPVYLGMCFAGTSTVLAWVCVMCVRARGFNFSLPILARVHGVRCGAYFAFNPPILAWLVVCV